MRQYLYCFLAGLVWLFSGPVPTLWASPVSVWNGAMQMAASGHLKEAGAHLSGAAAMISGRSNGLWHERMQLAVLLLDMRRKQSVDGALFSATSVSGWPETALIQHYIQRYPEPESNASPVTAGVLATLVPGAGHAWQGRWRDAAVAALLVIPMLLLTLWAARRRMGPVTLFFALITIWLWSGSVFSAISLVERGTAEAYLLWWQGLWQASALPGRPW